MEFDKNVIIDIINDFRPEIARLSSILEDIAQNLKKDSENSPKNDKPNPKNEFLYKSTLELNTLAVYEIEKEIDCLVFKAKKIAISNLYITRDIIKVYEYATKHGYTFELLPNYDIKVFFKKVIS